MNVSVLLMLSLVLLVKGSEYNSNKNKYTYEMSMACKEHICQSYQYTTFYRIDDTTLQRIKKGGELLFEMHLAIQASSNGHILLATKPNPGLNDPVYEIVVGGGGNRFTELRRNLKWNARVSIRTPTILSTIDPRGFYIQLFDDGRLVFGMEGETLPILSYLDTSPLDIQYFSFASWAGVEAKFLYDCPVPGKAEPMVPSSKAMEHKEPDSESLKRTLLMARNPSISPLADMHVTLGVKVTALQYDPKRSKLMTRMAVVMSWTDDSMAWNPDKFNKIINLKFRQAQIWRPKFFVYNSDNLGQFDSKNGDLISMVNSGEAVFHFQTDVTTWCDSPEAMSKWPRDEYRCYIVIEPWEVHEKISLTLMKPRDDQFRMFADIDEVVENEWAISASSHGTVNHSVWVSDYAGDNGTHLSDRYVMALEFRRRGTADMTIFYTPCLVLVGFVLLSFWWGGPRLWWYLGCVVGMSAALCHIHYIIPTHTVPRILVLYVTVLAGVLLAMLVQVLLASPSADNICRWRCVNAVLTCAALRVVLCMPPVKVSMNGDYSPYEPDDAIVGDVEEMEADEEKIFGDKKELSEVLDKLMFIVYSVVFAAMLAVHF